MKESKVDDQTKSINLFYVNLIIFVFLKVLKFIEGGGREQVEVGGRRKFTFGKGSKREARFWIEGGR